MSSRADKAAKSQKDKHHTILRELVHEPSNKTCAECLAKGKIFCVDGSFFFCIKIDIVSIANSNAIEIYLG